MSIIRYHILEGDTTTVGGIVQKTKNSLSFKVYGKQQSYVGDDVWCPACGTMGKIGADGARLKMSVNGYQPALHDDLCLCKCNPPPKLVNSQTTFKEIIENAGNGIEKNHLENANSKKFDKYIHFDFGEHKSDIASYLHYRLKIDGILYEGRLDSQGNTPIFYSDNIVEITDLELFIPEENTCDFNYCIGFNEE